jgi:DNA-binding NtrC family response regulator
MERIRLLLVDDEDDFRTTLASRLRKRDFDVTEVDSGYRALTSIRTAAIDVAVIDVRMRGMDGLETLREIRRIDTLIEVIMLTGHASVESAVEGMRLGAFDYLMKPCDINELVAKIQDAYQRKLVQEASIK